MTVFQAVVLGILQGLTEFLPVSSSAHLNLAPWAFGWRDPGLAFDVALHLGTLVALLWYSVGVSYGTMYEQWPIMKACRFALGAMAASGVPAPVCLRVDGQIDCQLGLMHDMLHFAITTSSFSAWLASINLYR